MSKCSSLCLFLRIVFQTIWKTMTALILRAWWKHHTISQPVLEDSEMSSGIHYKLHSQNVLGERYSVQSFVEAFWFKNFKTEVFVHIFLILTVRMFFLRGTCLDKNLENNTIYFRTRKVKVSIVDWHFPHFETVDGAIVFSKIKFFVFLQAAKLQVLYLEDRKYREVGKNGLSHADGYYESLSKAKFLMNTCFELKKRWAGKMWDLVGMRVQENTTCRFWIALE